MSSAERCPPPDARVSTLHHRVGYFETDAMGVVHHTNYIRFFENARVLWLDEHDVPYTEWQTLGIDLAVTRVDVDYHLPARFDDRLAVSTWLSWVRGASLAMAYRVLRGDELLVTGETEHAAVDRTGRVRRLPRERRDQLREALGGGEGLETS